MIASIRDTSDIFSGCLAYLRDDLTSELPPGKTWVNGVGIKGLIGSKEMYNEHNYLWDSPLVYYKSFIYSILKNAFFFLFTLPFRIKIIYQIAYTTQQIIIYLNL